MLQQQIVRDIIELAAKVGLSITGSGDDLTVADATGKSTRTFVLPSQHAVLVAMLLNLLVAQLRMCASDSAPDARVAVDEFASAYDAVYERLLPAVVNIRDEVAAALSGLEEEEKKKVLTSFDSLQDADKAGIVEVLFRPEAWAEGERYDVVKPITKYIANAAAQKRGGAAAMRRPRRALKGGSTPAASLQDCKLDPTKDLHVIIVSKHDAIPSNVYADEDDITSVQITVIDPTIEMAGSLAELLDTCHEFNILVYVNSMSDADSTAHNVVSDALSQATKTKNNLQNVDIINVTSDIKRVVPMNSSVRKVLNVFPIGAPIVFSQNAFVKWAAASGSIQPGATYSVVQGGVHNTCCLGTVAGWYMHPIFGALPSPSLMFYSVPPCVSWSVPQDFACEFRTKYDFRLMQTWSDVLGSWWYRDYRNKQVPCFSGRLQQQTGTCWFNAIVNLLLFTPRISEALVENYNSRKGKATRKDLAGCPNSNMDLAEWMDVVIYNILIKGKRASASNGNFVAPGAALTKEEHNNKFYPRRWLEGLKVTDGDAGYPTELMPKVMKACGIKYKSIPIQEVWVLGYPQQSQSAVPSQQSEEVVVVTPNKSDVFISSTESIPQTLSMHDKMYHLRSSIIVVAYNQSGSNLMSHAVCGLHCAGRPYVYDSAGDIVVQTDWPSHKLDEYIRRKNEVAAGMSMPTSWKYYGPCVLVYTAVATPPIGRLRSDPELWNDRLKLIVEKLEKTLQTAESLLTELTALKVKSVTVATMQQIMKYIMVIHNEFVYIGACMREPNHLIVRIITACEHLGALLQMKTASRTSRSEHWTGTVWYWPDVEFSDIPSQASAEEIIEYVLPTLAPVDNPAATDMYKLAVQIKTHVKTFQLQLLQGDIRLDR